MLGDHMRPDLQEQDVCEGCNNYIMYYSPEQFDPICTSTKTEATHCEDCCACYEIDTPDKWEIVYKTEETIYGKF